MKTNEIYQQVTDSIIELLENHLESWNKPWIAFGQDNDYARNADTQKYYRGINQFLLSFKLMRKDYFKNAWLTFNQVKNMGGHVLKGEKSTPIVFYKTAYIDKDKKYHNAEKVKGMSLQQSSTLELTTITLLKLYNVFNVAQTEGLDASFYEVIQNEPLQDFEKDESAENLILSTGAEIEIVESNRAYYDVKADKIRLPLREQFKGLTEPFYATALHELGHWTGSETRLNRDLKNGFGDHAYAKEELIAELTSAFCCASLGFSKTISSNAAYIKNWLSVLKEDNKAVIRAANEAQKAADYILGVGEFAAFQNE